MPHGLEDHTDEALVEILNRGGPEGADAFAALYFRHRDWVYRIACRFTPDRDEALDVLQETFAYLLGRFPGFQLRARMTTYLYPIIKNIALGRGRKLKRWHLGPMPDAEASAAASPAIPNYDPGGLEAALAILPDGQREVLLMRVVDEMALAEIAAALDIPVGTVKSRLHNALAALREDERCRRYFLQEHVAGGAMREPSRRGGR